MRQLQEIEVALMRVGTQDATWLAPHDEAALRWALSLARLSVVPVLQNDGDKDAVNLGHSSDPYRKRLFDLLAPCVQRVEGKGVTRVKRDAVRALIPHIREKCRDERRNLLTLFGARLPAKALDRAVRKRPFALVLGGGGGTGYVFMGAMQVLEEAGLVPDLMAGTSMGALLGAFRSRNRDFSLRDVGSLMNRLTWRRVFRLFDTGSRFGLPATLKLTLRAVVGHAFEQDGDIMRLCDMPIPFKVCVAGLTSATSDEEMDTYAHLLDDAVADVRGFRRRAKGIARALSAITSKPVKPIYLGNDAMTREFDLLDAIGFSCAVPGVIQYDVLRDDPRMTQLLSDMMSREGVFRLVDGGLADNLPSHAAWTAIQSGEIGARDPFVLALDSFAPRFDRQLMFLPLMRLAAETSKVGKRLAHICINFKDVLSPLALVPSTNDLARALENGKRETREIAPLARKLVGPIPNPPGILTQMDGT